MAEHSQPLDLEEALARISAEIAPIDRIERIKLEHCHRRILAAPVTSEVDLPPFRASAMDGYALRRADFERTRTLRCVGASLAGHPFENDFGAGECVRVFTGAVVPEGADQVALQEDTVAHGEAIDFTQTRWAESFIRPPGHDVGKGTVLAERGSAVDAFLLGSLAAAGVAEVSVQAHPTVGVFSTGDELTDPGTLLAPGQIYDSNRITVEHLLKDLPLEVRSLGRLPDEADAVRDCLATASRDCDALITSGGVSVGDADFVTSTIAKLGTLAFWRLNLKPGKPLAVGRIGHCHVFGLPGNPVSTIVTTLLIARPALVRLAGGTAGALHRYRTRLATPLQHTPGRAEYQRGKLIVRDDDLWVEVTGDQSSNRLQSFRDADCLIEVPKTAGDLSEGDRVQVLPLRGLL